MIDVYLNAKQQMDNNIVYDALREWKLELDIETMTYLFEALLEESNVTENGIVFTPQYIASFICEGIWKDVENWNEMIKIIDPGCGCGIFLISAILYIHDKYKVPIEYIIQNNIFGIDIDKNNVRRCKKLIKALAQSQNVNINEDDIHIVCGDSLKNDWRNLFDVAQFDYIIGNPPYVNMHDMNKDTADFLKKNFITTKTGVYNIFYAFIEQAMKFLSKDGKLSYIVPNNFLTIKSAGDLREYMQKKACTSTILDFGENMLFKPVRTYNCIIILNSRINYDLHYCVMGKTEDIKSSLQAITYNSMPLSRLDKNGWKLVDNHTYNNLKKIEGQLKPIKEFIRTGIATLRDEVFMVNQSEEGFYKILDGIRYDIESKLVKTVYKIPDLKDCKNIYEVSRHIIE